MSDSIVVWFQVPTVDNETRKAHPARLWAALENTLVARFGGLTRGPNVKGSWLDGKGTLISEPSRTYEVDVAAERLAEVKLILQGACSAFGQQCLRVKIEGRALYLNPAADQVRPAGLAL